MTIYLNYLSYCDDQRAKTIRNHKLVSEHHLRQNAPFVHGKWGDMMCIGEFIPDCIWMEIVYVEAEYAKFWFHGRITGPHQIKMIKNMVVLVHPFIDNKPVSVDEWIRYRDKHPISLTKSAAKLG